MKPPVVSGGKLKRKLFILIIVLAHIDMIAVAADIMKGLAGNLLPLCIALTPDITALNQLFLNLYQVLFL